MKQTAVLAAQLAQGMWLSGAVCTWTNSYLDVNALVTPLGLSGAYTVMGIDNDEEENQLPYPSLMGIDDDAWDARSARRDEVRAFIITCTPEMTAAHLMQIAAREHERRNGERSHGHIFFERLTIAGRVIEFDMGS